MSPSGRIATGEMGKGESGTSPIVVPSLPSNMADKQQNGLIMTSVLSAVGRSGFLLRFEREAWRNGAGVLELCLNLEIGAGTFVTQTV